MKLDPKGRLDLWGSQDLKDLRGLMDSPALESPVGQGCQGNQVLKASEDQRGHQALRVSKVLKERRALGCPACQASRVLQGCTALLALLDSQELANQE